MINWPAVTIEDIARRNPHLTIEDVRKRAEMSPAMMKRISERRQKEAEESWLVEPSNYTDEQHALQLVSEDAARERAEIDRARAEAETQSRIESNAPSHYVVSYTNEYGQMTIGTQWDTAALAATMAQTLLTQPSWGRVTSVEITARYDGAVG